MSRARSARGANKNQRVIVVKNENFSETEYKGMNNRSRLTTQLAAIAADIEASGRAIVDANDARILCPPELPVPKQLARLTQIAQMHEWSFAFLRGGHIEFRKIPRR